MSENQVLTTARGARFAGGDFKVARGSASCRVRCNRSILMWSLCVGLVCLSAPPAAAVDSWTVGFAKMDVTPDEPLRLSGYSNRSAPATGVQDPLAVRAMVIAPATAGDISRAVVLVSVDGIAIANGMTQSISQWLMEKYAIPRKQVVLCSSHSHTTPHVEGALNNMFRDPLTAEQATATRRYTTRLVESIKASIVRAVESRVSAKLSIGNGEAGFAINRRVLNEGKWSGFGEQIDGPVDHRVRVLVAKDERGIILGAAFMYACHCTTLGSDFNQVSADWAGLAASRLEYTHSGAIFLPVIGCGADANPRPRGSYDSAQQNAAELVDAIDGVMRGTQLKELAQFPQAHFGYAGLAPEQPSGEYLQEVLTSEKATDRSWAEKMLEIKKEMNRLPETYPMPIHSWQFGDELTWVFLGGEVVVEYQMLIEKELPTEQTWVAAYTDDVFAYVASERMRAEGGYEVDSSMMYYLQPGRWQAGTQALILRRVADIFRDLQEEDQASSAEDALGTMQVPDGFGIDLIAAEPLISDPVNIAFGLDGRVWLVEMTDYPLGTPGGGRVKWLEDKNGDGVLDEAHLYLQGLNYPTSVMPWRDGAIVIAAPDVIYATDEDRDGSADSVEVLLTGIGQANPQHRASGFEIGLDGWLHFSAGSETKQLTSTLTGEVFDVEGHDVAWNPNTGEVQVTSGETQFVRGRDAYGNWFGNSNSRPIYHYVVEDRYLRRGGISGGPRQDLLSPAVAPPVYPRSRTVDRFNDLFARNRFTSACSSLIVRVPGFSPGEAQLGFICEPVHNLVARIELQAEGGSFSAIRHPDDDRYDFLTSSDLWSRPVRIINAPDGTLWVLDMVRQVIEHPQWIPTAWQERLDLRSGEALGRIYRIRYQGWKDRALPRIELNRQSLVNALRDENGVVRDLALQAMVQANSSELPAQLEDDVREIARDRGLAAAVQISGLGCLTGMNWLSPADVVWALQSDDGRVVRYGLEIVERLTAQRSTPELQAVFDSVAQRQLGASVDLQWVLTASLLPGFADSHGFIDITARSGGNRWIYRALSLVQDSTLAKAIMNQMLDTADREEAGDRQDFAELENSMARLWESCTPEHRVELADARLNALLQQTSIRFQPSQLLMLSVLATHGGKHLPSHTQDALTQVASRARQRLAAADGASAEGIRVREQLSLVNLLGIGLTDIDEEVQLAGLLLDSERETQVKQAVIQRLQKMSSPAVAEVLIQRWPQFNSALRSTTATTLLSRPGWALAFVGALESEAIRVAELDMSTVQQLTGYRDREIRARCLLIFGQPSQRSHVVARYLSEMPAPKADESLGEQPGFKLFAEHCATCHQSAEGRPLLGPPLENLNHWTIEQWLTAILDPNQALEHKYRLHSIVTSDGQVVIGILLGKDVKATTLGCSDGSIRTIAVNEIESMKEMGNSLMPEGFEQKLSPKQLSQLLGFLRNR